MFKKILPLTSIISLRFFSLFIVLPTLSLYASEITNSTNSAVLIGLAVGGAYITQVIFQTPFGILSDKYNRKLIVALGLIIFLVGSMICGYAQDIQTLVIGRFIQGIGAIGGVVSAWVSDLTYEEERTKAMAILGGGIFLSFILALIIGPIVTAKFGGSWLFWLTSFLTLLSLIILLIKAPSTPILRYKFSKKPSLLEGLKGKDIWIMNLSSFLEKMLMTLTFVLIPLILIEYFNFSKENLWKIYVPSALIGIFSMGPASILAEKKNHPKLVLLIGVLIFLFAYTSITLAYQKHVLWIFFIGILLFFIGFGMLEPIMQSLVSKYSKAYLRGLILGNFTTASYIGSFLGGVLGAWLYHHWGLLNIGISTIILCALWLIVISLLSNPKNTKNLYISYQTNPEFILDEIRQKPGIIESYINESQKCIIVKYDTLLIAQKTLQSIQSLSSKNSHKQEA